MSRLPKPRGPLSDAVQAVLTGGSSQDFDAARPRLETEVDDLAESPDDAALTLWTLHELHHRGFEEVDERAEWDPDLIRVRVALEQRLESELRARWPGVPAEVDLEAGFFDWLAEHDGPSIARFVQSRATRDQVLDLLRVRSVYHLKEADPAAWVIPRLHGRAKAALAEIQYDEYGAGRPERLHSTLWERGMEAHGLRVEPAAYVDEAPLEALEQSNALVMFGLHRRLRGAAMGHLAAFEATSSLPSRRLARGLERLGMADELIDYYLEHVEADAVHEQVALRDICVAMTQDEPALLPDIWFGAWACLDLEDRTARRLLEDWGVPA